MANDFKEAISSVNEAILNLGRALSGENEPKEDGRFKSIVKKIPQVFFSVLYRLFIWLSFIASLLLTCYGVYIILTCRADSERALVGMVSVLSAYLVMQVYHKL